MTREKVDSSLKESKPKIGGRLSAGTKNLTSSFDLVEEMHFLFLKIVRARNLPQNDETSVCDPFVEVKIGNYKGTTRYFESKPEPEWNQVFAFGQSRLQALSVEINVKDKSAASSDIIGKVVVSMSDIPTRVPPDCALAPQWYKLEDKNGEKQGRGELMFVIWFGTQADEVFPECWHSDTTCVSGEAAMVNTPKMYLSPRLWYLRVNIIQAQDLVPQDKEKTPEVYIKAILGTLALKTRVSPNKNVNPTWNEDLMFVVAEPFEDPLVLNVINRVGNNVEEILGRCVIPLSKVDNRLSPAAASARWYDLEKIVVVEGAEKKFAGKLNMRVSLDGGYHVLDESIQYSSDYRATAKMYWPGTVGVLELGIISAKDLLPMKSRNGVESTDAYCVAKYGPKWVRTRTVVDSFDPEWNEQYTWEVYDPYTVLTIGVFDNSNLQGGDMLQGAKDPRIGKVRIRLSTLETNRTYTHFYPLVILQPNGVKKMGEIQLAIRFSCPSWWKLLRSYTQPLFSKMHYLHPLSAYQLDSLRQQACHILSLRLGRTEPPLRKEVIEYVLDKDDRLWSLRRSRANFQRLLAAVNGANAAWRWFDDARQWKSSTLTVVITLISIAVAFSPNLTLALIFFYCFLYVLWRWRQQPKHPLHMDVKLSLADSVSADELDEEFDTFPSSAQGDVLRMRYDRLRIIAGRVMTLVGDLATQGERLQSVVSWQDPRATSMFMAFSLMAAVVFYITPPWVWKIFLPLYVMRPPFFRVTIPSIPQNFFRRLPAKSDCLL